MPCFFPSQWADPEFAETWLNHFISFPQPSSALSLGAEPAPSWHPFLRTPPWPCLAFQNKGTCLLSRSHPEFRRLILIPRGNDPGDRRKKERLPMSSFLSWEPLLLEHGSVGSQRSPSSVPVRLQRREVSCGLPAFPSPQCCAGAVVGKPAGDMDGFQACEVYNLSTLAGVWEGGCTFLSSHRCVLKCLAERRRSAITVGSLSPSLAPESRLKC